MKIWKNKFLKQMIIIVTVVYLIMNCIAPSTVYANKSQESSGIDWKSIVSNIAGIAVGGLIIGAGIATGGVGAIVAGVIKGAIAYKVVGAATEAVIEGDSISDIPGNLLKEFLQFMVSVGDVVIGGLQAFMLDDGTGFSHVMISNKDNNLGSGSDGKGYSGSWLYANEDDVAELQKGNSSRGASALIIASKKGIEDNLYVEGDYKVPNILYSPESIFSNKIAALDANYINPHSYTSVIEGGEENESLASEIAPTVATWYRALRNLAIVGLLSVLVYIGIRILIGTVSEKAKYKERLFDWFVALCMVFFMHFIMAGIMMVAEKIMDLVGSAGNFGIVVSVDDGAIFKTTFMGLIRFCAQSNSWTETAGYSIMYLLLVGITIKYTYIYLKRALYLAFFTIIAPMVALTYPLDKIKDSQAQAFNMWIKEYFINAIIQPVHLLLYTVFVGSSMSLAVVNPIYGVVVLLFLPTAEKWIKKMFKIDKAPLTATSLGDMALLGTMFGMGKNIVGGAIKGVTTLGSAVATGKMSAVGSGVVNSYLGAPYRAVKTIHDKFSEPKGEGVEDTVKTLPEVDQNNLQYYNDMKESGYSKEELAELADDLDLTEYLQQKQAQEITSHTKDVSSILKGKPDPGTINNGENLDDMSSIPQQLDDKTTSTTARARQRLNQNQNLDDMSGVPTNKENTKNVNVNTITNTNEGTGENTNAEKAKEKESSEYEKAMLQDRKREKLYKAEESDEIKNLINQGIVGIGGAVVGAAAGTIMAGAMDDSKMMAAGALGGATGATAIRNIGTEIKNAEVKNNIKILVKEGITNNNVIKNAAQVASQSNWSEDKMKMVAKMADIYPDLAKNQENMKALTEDLKKAGLEDKKMRDKAIQDVMKVQANAEQAERKEKNKGKKNIENWK